MDDKRYDACVDLMKDLRSRSDDLLGADLPNGKRAEFQNNSYSVIRYDLGLHNDVGDATLEIETDGVGTVSDGVDTSMLSDYDGHVFKFECRLGPVNARQLIAFLKCMQPEPEDVCSECGGSGFTGRTKIPCGTCGANHPPEVSR